MPIERPTLSELRTQARADMAVALPEADAGLRTTNLRVIADVIAGLMHLQYGWLDWLQRQVLPDTAETEYLERWAAIFGLTRRPASAALGSITVTGTPAAAVPAGTELQRADRVAYRTLAAASIAAGGSVEVPVEASEPGEAGNTDVGTRLSFVSALAGVSAQALVAAGGITGGSGAEDDDALRARLLSRIQQPPHGGAARDYVAWTLEVPGVDRAWVYPGELGIGTVTVRFTVTDPDPIPSSAMVEAVAAHIEDLRPVTAEVVVVAPVGVPLAVTIADLSPDTPAIRAAIEAELADTLRRQAEPGVLLSRSWIAEAVARAVGERRHRLVLPADDVPHAVGHMPVLGVVSYV
jgi:uncharacterized phage protein gp47/JayE